MLEDICTNVAATDDERVVTKILSGFRHREMLRIAYGDIVRSQNLETVTAQISYLADAIIEAAVQSAWRLQVARRGVPVFPTVSELGSPCWRWANWVAWN